MAEALAQATGPQALSAVIPVRNCVACLTRQKSSSAGADVMDLYRLPMDGGPANDGAADQGTGFASRPVGRRSHQLRRQPDKRSSATRVDGDNPDVPPMRAGVPRQ